MINVAMFCFKICVQPHRKVRKLIFQASSLCSTDLYSDLETEMPLRDWSLVTGRRGGYKTGGGGT